MPTSILSQHRKRLLTWRVSWRDGPLATPGGCSYSRERATHRRGTAHGTAHLSLLVPRRAGRQRPERARGPRRRVRVPLRPCRRGARLQGHLLPPVSPAGTRCRSARSGRQASSATPASTCSSTTRPPWTRPTASPPCASRCPTTRSRPAPTWSGWTTCSSSPRSASTCGASTSTCCTRPSSIAPHQLKLPHAMKRTASGRFVVYGGMDHPDRGEAREVGILDLRTGEARRVELPTTCWHVAVHPTEDLFYALSFRVAPAGRLRLPRVGDGLLQGVRLRDRRRERRGDPALDRRSRGARAHQLRRHHLRRPSSSSARAAARAWCCSTSSRSPTSASSTSGRTSPCRPDTDEPRPRQVARRLLPRLTGHQQPALPERAAGEPWLAARLVYACQLSADQTLLFTANRGLNHITVYDYPSMTRAATRADAGPAGVRHLPVPLGGPPPRVPPQPSGQPQVGNTHREDMTWRNQALRRGASCGS